MPIPKPKEGEEEKEFISRCMSDEVMVNEYPDQEKRAAICYTQWRERDNVEDNFSEIKTYEVKNVPIFEAGTWKGGKIKYTVEQIKKLVEAFNELKGRIIPYVALGHEGNTEILSGQPRVGYLDNLRAEGNRLWADIKGMPKKVYELFKAGLYNSWSVEIAKNWKDTIKNKTYDRLLAGVVLLGAEHPAVNTIADYHKMLFSDATAEMERFGVEIGDSESVKFSITVIPERGGEVMDNEKEVEQLRAERDALKAKLEAQEQALQAQSEEALKIRDELEAKYKEKVEELAERDRTEKRKKIDEFTEKFVEKGKILPWQVDMYKDQLERAENLDEMMGSLAESLEKAPNLVELEDIASDQNMDDQPENVKKEYFKDSFVADAKNTGNRMPEDESLIDEFATVFATHKPGERAENLVRSREALREEIEKYL